MAFIKKMTFVQTLEACGYLEESNPVRREQQCHDPKLGAQLEYLRDRKEAKVAGVQRPKVRGAGTEVRRVTVSGA